MRGMRGLIVLGLGIVAAASASQYAGQETRAIKALSPAEIQDLLDGKGMGLAKAAELNQYPGPRHVLELADALELSEDQIEKTRAIFAEMAAEARRLGATLVGLERELDGAFASRTVTRQSLADTLQAIGQTRAALRGTHLEAHLAMREVLTPHQIRRYDRLRGYAHGDARHEHRH